MSGLVLSLGFWAALFAAAVLLAVVSLGPRWVRKVELERSFTERQVELVDLEREVRQLELVASRLVNDPRAAARFDPHHSKATQHTRRGGTAIELAPELRHDPRAAMPPRPAVEWSDPWYLPLLKRVSESPATQLRACLVAAGLLLAGFVFLHEHAGATAVGRALAAPFLKLGRRYGAARGSETRESKPV